MRKSAKMLSYDLEMLEGAAGLGGRRVARLADDLGSLQDNLGLVQDQASAREMLDAATAGRRPDGGVSRAELRKAARALRPTASGDSELLRKAGKVARRLRRPVAFG